MDFGGYFFRKKGRKAEFLQNMEVKTYKRKEFFINILTDK